MHVNALEFQRITHVIWNMFLCCNYFVFTSSYFSLNKHQLPCIKWRARNIYLIHFRLCKRWLIDLIVSKPVVTNNIHNNVRLECLTPLGSKFTCMYHSFQIITIYMENWSIQGFCNIYTVLRRPSSFGISCEYLQ